MQNKKKKRAGVVTTVTFDLKTSFFILGVGAILIGAYAMYPSYRGLVVFSASVVGGIGAILSAFYVALSLETQIERDKVHQSFEFSKQLNELHVIKARTFLEREIDSKSLTPRQFYEKVMENDESLVAVRSLLGLFEDLSIGIRYGYVDELPSYESLAHIVTWSFDAYKPFIDEYRTARGVKGLYGEVEDLANAWRNGKSLVTQHTFEKRMQP